MKEFKDVKIILFSTPDEARNYQGHTASIAGGPIQDGVYLLRASYDLDKVKAFAGTVKTKKETPKAKEAQAKGKPAKATASPAKATAKKTKPAKKAA